MRIMVTVQWGWMRALIAGILVAGMAVCPALGEAGALTLEEALHLAEERNPDLESVRQELRIARGQVRETRAEALPRVDMSAMYVRLHEAPSIQVGAVEFPMGREDNIEVTAEIRQLLYAGGGVRAALSLAREYEGVVIETEEEARRQTAYAVHTAFNRVLLARTHVEVAAEALEWARRNREDVRVRVEQGLATRFDRLRADAQVSHREADLIAAENGLDVSRMALLRLLDLPLDDSRAVTGELLFVPVELLGDAAVEEAQRRRADLAAARRLVEVLREAVRVARSGTRPTVAAFGQYMQQNPDRAAENAWEDSWRVGVRADFPLFDGHRTSGRIQQAEAQLRQAELQVQSLSIEVRFDVKRAELDLAAMARRVEALDRTADESREALRLAHQAYAEGTGAQIDVIAAQAAFAESRRLHASAVHDHTMARRTWELARGVL